MKVCSEGKNRYRIFLDADYKKVENHLEAISRFAPSLSFDMRHIRRLEKGALQEFRRFFLKLILRLRDRKVVIDFDDIRRQSVRYGKFLIGPKKLQLSIIDQCNYRCLFCMGHSPMLTQRERGFLIKKPMPFPFIKQALDEAYAMGTEVLIFSGEAGEPFLHPDIKRIIAYARSRDFAIEILSNASVIDEATFDMFGLLNGKKLSFRINLCATTPQEYKLIHGGDPGQFGRLLTTIERLSKSSYVLLSYLWTRHNYENVLDYFELADSLGIKNVLLRIPLLYSEKHRTLLPSRKERRVFLAQVPQIMRFAGERGISHNMSKFLACMREGVGRDEPFLLRQEGPRRKTCCSSWFFSKIASNSKVSMCCLDGPIIGRSKAGEFQEVYFSQKAVSLSLEAKAGFDTRLRRWQKCRYCEQAQISFSGQEMAP